MLLIGASRVAGLRFQGNDAFACVAKSYPGAPLKKILEEADTYLQEHTEVQIIVIIGFQCDLSERRRYMPGGGMGLASALSEPKYDQLTNLVTYYDYAWRSKHNVSVFWTLPYDTDFLQYNLKLVGKLKLQDMCQAQRYDSNFSTQLFRENVEKLGSILTGKPRNIQLIALNDLEPVTTKATGGDGLHLGAAEKEKLFTEVFERVIKLHPVPLPEMNIQPKSLEERDHIREKRHQKRARKLINKKADFHPEETAAMTPSIQSRLSNIKKAPKRLGSPPTSKRGFSSQKSGGCESKAKPIPSLSRERPSNSYAESQPSTSKGVLASSSSHSWNSGDTNQQNWGCEYENESCYVYQNPHPQDEACKEPPVYYDGSNYDAPQYDYNGASYAASYSTYGSTASQTSTSEAQGYQDSREAHRYTRTRDGYQDAEEYYGDSHSYSANCSNLYYP